MGPPSSPIRRPGSGRRVDGGDDDDDDDDDDAVTVTSTVINPPNPPNPTPAGSAPPTPQVRGALITELPPYLASQDVTDAQVDPAIAGPLEINHRGGGFGLVIGPRRMTFAMTHWTATPSPRTRPPRAQT